MAAQVGAAQVGAAKLTVARVAPPAAPYRSEPVLLPGAGGAMLAGTLTRPRAPGAVPAVLLLPRAPGLDRDGAPLPGAVDAALAAALSRDGIAVLRLDGRGAGASGGTVQSATIETSAEDAADAVAWLRARSGIAWVGLIGAGQGEAWAPLVAIGSRQVRAVVLIGKRPAPALAAEQARGALVLRNRALARRVVALAANPAVQPDAARAGIVRLLVAGGIDAAHAAALAQALVAPPYRSLLGYDPLPALQAWRGALLELPRIDAARIAAWLRTLPAR